MEAKLHMHVSLRGQGLYGSSLMAGKASMRAMRAMQPCLLGGLHTAFSYVSVLMSVWGFVWPLVGTNTNTHFSLPHISLI